MRVWRPPFVPPDTIAWVRVNTLAWAAALLLAAFGSAIGGARAYWVANTPPSSAAATYYWATAVSGLGWAAAAAAGIGIGFQLKRKRRAAWPTLLAGITGLVTVTISYLTVYGWAWTVVVQADRSRLLGSFLVDAVTELTPPVSLLALVSVVWLMDRRASREFGPTRAGLVCPASQPPSETNVFDP
jgi:hypothetical protein